MVTNLLGAGVLVTVGDPVGDLEALGWPEGACDKTADGLSDPLGAVDGANEGPAEGVSLLEGDDDPLGLLEGGLLTEGAFDILGLPEGAMLTVWASTPPLRLLC